MASQNIYADANTKRRRKLFVDNGFEYFEVNARIIEPYTNPTPQMNAKEIKLINAPSHIHQMGISSYKATLTLLFPDRNAYAEYMSYVGWPHKFYDERGYIYVGAVESMKTTSVQIQQKYKTEITLLLIRKSQIDHQKQELPFQDVPENYEFYKEIADMARLGIVTTYNDDGQPTLYFNPSGKLTRAQMAAMIMRTKRFLDKMLKG